MCRAGEVKQREHGGIPRHGSQSNGSTIQLVVADGSCHSIEVNTYRAVPNPKSTGGAWAIEWTADGVVSGYICRELETEVDAAIMAYELAMVELKGDRPAFTQLGKARARTTLLTNNPDAAKWNGSGLARGPSKPRPNLSAHRSERSD
jgi:hypothetical protein